MAVRLPSPADSYQTSGEVLQDFPSFFAAFFAESNMNCDLFVPAIFAAFEINASSFFVALILNCSVFIIFPSGVYSISNLVYTCKSRLPKKNARKCGHLDLGFLNQSPRSLSNFV